jgi:hypothetical protein
MQVTCQICKKKIEKDTAYKRVVGKANKYYCSEQEWQAEEDKKKKAAEDKNKVYNLICDMFGYEIVNTQFFAEWTLWCKLKSNEIIYKYLRENEDYLQQICDRVFNSEYQKIRYFSAVLKNSLRDFEPRVEISQVEKPKVVIEETMYNTTPTNTKSKRRGLADLEDDII